MDSKDVNEIKDDNRQSLIKTVFLVFIAVAAGFGGGWYGGKNAVTSQNSSNVVSRQVIDNEGDLINTIAKDLDPSVVSVEVLGSTFSEGLFDYGREIQSQSAGTGFVIDKSGLILTNRHVVPEDTTKVTVVFSDGTKSDAEVIGRTNESDPLDIAFLKISNIDGLNLVPVKLGDSNNTEVGDRVVAIGNALGEFQNTVTSGIISGFGRNIEASDGTAEGTEVLQNLFQTDAAINSGNSGGPLVNSASEVIGVNVATATAENISFAIPINDVKPLIDIVLETGKLERPYLGVRYITLDEEVANYYDLKTTSGVYIPSSNSGQASILPGSPAEKAGLKEGDAIIEIDGTKLDDKNSLVGILGKKRVGTTVSLKIVRDGNEMSLSVTLEATPAQ